MPVVNRTAGTAPSCALGALATLVLFAATPVARAHAQGLTLDASRTYQLVSMQSGRCLQVGDGPDARQDGALLQQWSCTQLQNQRFRFRPIGDGFYQLAAVHSDKCLDLPSASKTSGTRVQQFQCHTGENQQWRVLLSESPKAVPAGGPVVRLISRHSRMALDVAAGGAAENGAAVRQWDPTGGANQQWQLTTEVVVTANRAERGCYRVLLTGFHVEHQTADHVLDADGKGDEVYVLSDSWRADRQGRVSDHQVRRSVVMGDMNGQDVVRLRAGSASDAGGIRSGDRVPTAEPWTSTGDPRADRLPMLLWQGELVDRESAVVVQPTIWEWDNGGGDLRGTWPALMRNDSLIGASLVPLVANLAPGGRPPVHAFSQTFALERNGDRPIGYQPAEANAWWKYGYAPKRLILDYRIAEDALTRSFIPNRPGIVGIRYQEPVRDVLDGDYTLYLKVERASACGS